MIWFHGQSSDDLHLIVERYPERPVPRRKTDSVSVPGRSGDLLFPQEAFENVIQPYEVYISGEFNGKLPNVARHVMDWLMVPGYQRLEDSYDLEVYRLATFEGGTNFENTFNLFGRGTIEFNCKPQRFLKSGAIPRQITNGQTLVNPTICTALPLIVVSGSGAGTLRVGDNVLRLLDCNEVTLDSEIQDAYRGVENMNPTVSGEYGTLPAGNTVISWTGGISSVQLTPRWFSL